MSAPRVVQERTSHLWWPGRLACASFRGAKSAGLGARHFGSSPWGQTARRLRLPRLLGSDDLNMKMNLHPRCLAVNASSQSEVTG